MSRKVLGIDIRNESVSAVLVKTSIRENRIDTHAYIPISDPEDDPDHIKTALEALTGQIDPDISPYLILRMIRITSKRPWKH